MAPWSSLGRAVSLEAGPHRTVKAPKGILASSRSLPVILGLARERSLGD